MATRKSTPTADASPKVEAAAQTCPHCGVPLAVQRASIATGKVEGELHSFTPKPEAEVAAARSAKPKKGTVLLGRKLADAQKAARGA